MQEPIVWSPALAIGKLALVREQVSLIFYEFSLDIITLGQNFPSLFRLNHSFLSAPEEGVSKLC